MIGARVSAPMILRPIREEVIQTTFGHNAARLAALRASAGEDICERQSPERAKGWRGERVGMQAGQHAMCGTAKHGAV